MDCATEDLYFQKLQELIQDADKIVTVPSIASDLGISIQESQKLIRQYVDDQRKLKPDELAITYVLTGMLKDNKGKGVFMVKENDLEKKCQMFENEPCNLIYSVQKNRYIDFNVIALVDMFDSTNIRAEALKGSIVSKNCVKRILKFKKILPLPPASKGKSLFASKSGTLADTDRQQPEVSKSEHKNKSSNGNIANLFKAAAAKSNQQTPQKGSASNSTKSNKQASKQNGGLAGFLTNGALKSKPGNHGGVKKEDDIVTAKDHSNKSETQESTKKEEILEILDVEFEDETSKHAKENNAPKKDSKKNKREKKKQNKRQRDTSAEIPSKKRKRIIERNDSDSDDMFEREEENEDFIEKSDEEPERIPSPVRELQLPPKNKRRKAVTRNYEDEEGFIVTKTEYVYETASEEDEVQKPPKQEKQEQEKPKQKVTDKTKAPKNQATLMQFFKKV